MFCLNTKHEEKMSFFNNKKKINQIIKDKKTRLNNLDTSHFDYAFQKKKLEKEIENLQSGNEMIEYLTNTSELLMNYNTILNEEFKLENNSDINDEIKKNELLILHEKKNNIIQDYLCMTNDPNLHKFNYIRKYIPICKYCNIYMFKNEYDLFFYCNKCEYTIEELNLASELSYKEKQNQNLSPKKPNPYERITYLEDYLKKLENNDKIIPQYVMDKIINQIKIENIDITKSGAEVKMKKILKTIDHPEYYSDRVLIINKLNGRSLKIPENIKQVLYSMFKKIQEPYNKFKPNNRSSFFSYPYILYQFFNILGLPEYTKFFTLLKSEEKLRIQDEIFKKVIDELKKTDNSGINWKFFPTI